MSTFATRRLIEASAVLEPADRALLNLWIHRGLDDARLAALTGMDAEAVAARRARIVTVLSAGLGVSESDVRATLTEIAPESPALPAAAEPSAQVEADAHLSHPEPEPEVRSEGPSSDALPPEATAAAAAAPPIPVCPPREHHLRVVPPLPPDPAPPPAPEPSSSAPTRARHRWAAVFGAIAVAAAIVVVIILLSAGSGRHTPRRAGAGLTSAADATSTPTTSQTSSSTTSSTPTPGASASAAARSGAAVGAAGTSRRLGDFPGGLTSASGMVALSGHAPHLKLTMRVRHLPTIRSGHYEAWLFSSVVDSRRLGRVGSGSHTVVFRLPAGARHYRWIDVTYQPAGSISYSGEARLRARNPVDGPRAVLRAHTARVPHRLSGRHRRSTPDRHRGARRRADARRPTDAGKRRRTHTRTHTHRRRHVQRRRHARPRRHRSAR